MATMPPKKRTAYMTPERLREIVAASGLRQREIAERLDIDRSTLVRWLAGTTPVSKANARLITLLLVPKK